MTPLVAHVHKRLTADIEVKWHRINHSDTMLLAKILQVLRRFRIAAEVRRDDDGLLCVAQSLADLLDVVGTKGTSANGLPFCGIDGVLGDMLFEDFAASDQVCWSSFAASDLTGAQDDLLDVAAGTDLMVVDSVAAKDATLIHCVLDIMDEFL